MTVALAVDRTWDGQPARPDESVELSLLDAGPDLRLRIDAPFHGDPPPPGPPGPTWALSEHEVAELFILGADQRYLEVEVGPHGHHLVLQLHGVRQVVARLLPLDLRVQRDGGRWTADALLPRTLLPPGPHRLNATAVHGQGISRRFLAWAPMPGPTPDFHRLDAWRPVLLPGTTP